MAERFPYILLSYWWIRSCVGTIPPVSYLAIWYTNLIPDETLIVVPWFHIENAILEVNNSGPYFFLTSVSFHTWKWVQIVNGLEWILTPLLWVRPHIYSILGSKPIEGIMHVALVSLIVGHWWIYIFFFVIGFNPYNFYALLYGTPIYFDISICS